MANYESPGVYIEEISTLPASIAPVATAIPAFIGYTESHIRNNESVKDKTIRITSLLEFKEIYGGPFVEELSVQLSGPSTKIEDTEVTLTHTTVPYCMYYQVAMYFENGGGPCYIASVGTYETNAADAVIDKDLLVGGLVPVSQEDEVTLLVVPEAVSLDDGGRKELYDAMLAQCKELLDRFSIFDVIVDANNSVKEDGDHFRNSNISTDNLKYGAAYYPSLQTSMNFYFENDKVNITDNRTGAVFTGGATLSTILNGEKTGTPAKGVITITDHNNIDGDSFTINGNTVTEGVDFDRGGGIPSTRNNLLVAITGLNDPTFTADKDTSGDNNKILIETTSTGADATLTITYNDNGNVGAEVQVTSGTDGILADKSLYNLIVKEIKKKNVSLYPCGSVAGVYARVDGDRGVWKAPANVSMNMVKNPVVPITREEQDNLNVDATSGKSINAIRKFSGKGILIWGARTLAGNDNEWRYIPVRRLFIFVEESTKKATEFVVFEPNDAKTWIRVKTMIENFLVKLWKDGALAGAKPEEAFFVKVGLGQTMTALDILEGRLNIEIGLAAVRPAEFIILKFSHKLQES